MTCSAVVWIIDERGQVMTPGDRQWRVALGTKREPASLMPYLVNSMGFIWLKDTPRTLDVMFEPSVVSPIALTALITFLFDCAEKPVTIRTQTDSVSILAVPNRTQALKYIGQQIERRSSRPRFWRHSVPISATSFNTHVKAATTVVSANMDETLRTRLLNSLFRLFAICQLDEASGHYRLQCLADGIEHLDPKLAGHGRGKTYHDALHDPEFGAWVASSIAEMADTAEPVTEVIEATINMAGRPEPVRASYTRLMLPFVRQNNRSLLIASDIRY